MNENGFVCPLPLRQYASILLAHGGGGQLSQDLIRHLFLPNFENPLLAPMHDGALLEIGGAQLAFTTDSYVVSPLFFPGGDIGALAVNGTVNDLAVCGAKPLYLSCAFILEEGLKIETLAHIARSVRQAAQEAGVLLVTGDTKVVEKGKGDGLFLNTSGLGIIQRPMRPAQVKPGDAILVSGSLGDHGVAILSVREGLEFEGTMQSDTANLYPLVESLMNNCTELHCMRDPTRGGLASTLNEISASAGVGMVIEEKAIPVRPEVQGACEILGLDPLYVANEGKLVAFVAAAEAEKALAALQSHPLGKAAAIIGHVTQENPGLVVMRTAVGGERIVEMMSGEQLPRIC
jgi:hydrogenase expression/formation protein HypE